MIDWTVVLSVIVAIGLIRLIQYVWVLIAVVIKLYRESTKL